MTPDPNYPKSPVTPAPSAAPNEAYPTTVVQTTRTNWAGPALVALAIAGAFGYSLYQSSQFSKELTSVRRQLADSDQRVADMKGQMATTSDESKRAVSESVAKLNTQLEQARKEAAAGSSRAQYAVRQQSGKLMKDLTAKNTELAQQLDQFKQDNTAKSTEVDEKITGIKGDVGDVKTEVASTKADLDNTKTDLRRAVGDMGVMSGLIATNSSELGELRKLGERNYIEFTLPKNGTPQKVGDVQMALKKTDMKRSRFTLDLLADDKRIEKRDKTVNEPVQFYTSSMRLPYEVVINSVTKDSVKGYLAVPKVKMAMR